MPIDRQRAVVADLVEAADDRLPVDAAAAGAAELPAAPRVAARPVPGEQPRAAVEAQHGVLQVDVVDAVGEAAQEGDGVDALPVQVAGVEEDAELLAGVQHVEDDFGRVEVEGELPRMHLAGEADAAVARGVEDRVPLRGERLQGVGDHPRLGRGVAGGVGPNRRAGEAAHDVRAQLLGEAEGRAQLLGGAVRHAVGPAVAPDVVGHQRFVAGVHGVGDRLADFVRSNDGDLQVVAGEEFEPAGGVAGLGEAELHFEVVAPAAEFSPW